MSDESSSGMKPELRAQDLSSPTVKQCCAAIYESDAARLLFGDSFHPGGAKLTERLGRILNLTSRTRVLDVAAGNGTSAIIIADVFGCQVVGVDYGQ
jgi:cyclopropane fatty-acyl-phospholipid synthase-like methyltransferase